MPVDPIYKTKDGQTVTKKQLIDSGYDEEKINKGLSGGVLSLIGDTENPSQTFVTKEGKMVTTEDLLGSGYSQDRINKGVHNGILTPQEKSGSASAVGAVGSEENDKKNVIDYVNSMKSKQSGVIKDAVTETPIKKDDNPFTQTKEQAVSEANQKLSEIMYSDGQDWKDPIKATIVGAKNATSTKDAAKYLGAKTLTEQSLMPDGFEAKKTLVDTILGQLGQDNMTTQALKDKAEKYDKIVAPFRNIEVKHDLKGADDLFLKNNYGDQINNAAIRSYAEKNPSFKKELEATGIDINDPNLSDKINSGKRGAIINDALNDPDVATYFTKENGSLIPAVENTQKNLLADNVEYGVNVVANKVSQAVQKSGFNNIDPVVNYYGNNHREYADLVAKEVLTPEELKIWNDHIRDNQEQYIDAPSFLEGFASTGKDFGKGIVNTFTQPFTSESKTIRDKWVKEASNVSANPEGLSSYIREAGSTFGLVSSILATGNLTGIANPNTAGMVATSLGFFGDQLQEGKNKYPDSPIKAWTSAAVNTSLYAALSMDLFPGSKVKAAFEDVKPEISTVVENLASGKITKEAARQKLNTLGKKAMDLAGGTLSKSARISAETTGITGFNRGLDKIMGQDPEGFEKSHPDDEIAKSLSSNFFNFLPVAGLARFGEMKRENTVVGESLYKAAANPKMFERIINELAIKDPSINKDDLLKNLKIISDTKKVLDENIVPPKEQKKYLFHALTEEALKKQKEDLLSKTISIQNEVLRNKEQEKIAHVDAEINKSKAEQKSILDGPQSDDEYKKRIAEADTEEEKELLMKQHGEFLIRQQEQEVANKQNEQQAKQEHLDFTGLRDDDFAAKYFDSDGYKKFSHLEIDDPEAARKMVADKKVELNAEKEGAKPEEKTPEQVIVDQAGKGSLVSMYNTLVTDDPSKVKDVLLDYAKQKYGVSDKGESVGDGREITNKEVDKAVTQAFPDKQSVMDLVNPKTKKESSVKGEGRGKEEVSRIMEEKLPLTKKYEKGIEVIDPVTKKPISDPLRPDRKLSAESIKKTLTKRHNALKELLNCL